jgi:hypothetical protein
MVYLFETCRGYLLEYINRLNAELNPISRLIALAGAHHFVDVSRIRVKKESASRLFFLRKFITLHGPCNVKLNQVLYCRKPLFLSILSGSHLSNENPALFAQQRAWYSGTVSKRRDGRPSG